MAQAPSIRRRPTERAIASEFACTEQEVAFVRTYVAMGQEFRYGPEAFRRSHCRRRASNGDLVEAGRDIPIDALESVEAYPALSDKDCRKRAQELLDLGHVAGYLEELNLSTTDAARVELRRQLLVGDERQRADASSAVRKEEDKHRFLDDVARYKDVMRATGVPIVLPLPEKVVGLVRCPNCALDHRAELYIDLEVPFGEMWPAEPEPDAAAE